MKKIEQALEEMESILDLLIKNAENLQQLSLQVIAQEELISLQRKQEELIGKLLDLDADFYKNYPKEAKQYQSKTRENISHKLDKFQRLNGQFIDNVTKSQGLIKFELSKKQQ